LSGAKSSALWLRIAVGIAALAALIALGRLAGGYVETFRSWVEGLGPAGILVYGLAYAVGVVSFVPGSLLTIAGGAAFGLWKGTLVVFCAALLGAIAAFLIARYLARNAIEQRLSGNARFAAIDRAIGNEGLKIVFLLRLSPVFPFNLLNYGLGLTKVRLRDYAIAGLGMLPGTLLYVYIGSLAGDVAKASAAGSGSETGQTLLAIVGFAATLAVTVLITRTARRALREAADLAEEES